MLPVVAVIMGSKSDWETMQYACQMLDDLQIPYEKKVVSAHRTPDLMFTFAEEAAGEGFGLLLLEQEEQRICQVWWQRRQSFQLLVFRFNRRH